MEILSKSDIGLVRKSNQDAFCAETLPSGDAFAVVCDGMGGASGGQIASKICVERVSTAIKRGYREGMTVKSAENLLTSAINAANSAVFEQSCKNIELRGMGTTVVAVIVLKKIAVIAHVGDSRAYLLNDNIKSITKDHSLVQLLLDSGKISEETAKVHPDRNVITRAVGIENFVDTEFDIVDIEEGSALLICTDGLNGYISDSLIYETVNKYGDSSAEKLVEAANNAGGKDNVTVVLLVDNVQGE